MHEPNDKRVFSKEALSLAKAGHEVTHLCPGDARYAGFYSGVRTVTYIPPQGMAGRLQQLVNLYRKASKLNADAYHCNEVDSWVIGVFLRIFRKKICVFDVHEHYPSTFAESRFPVFIRPFISMLILVLFRILIPFTDRIVLAKETVSADFHTSNAKKVLVKNYTPLEAIKFTTAGHQGRENSSGVLIHLGLFSKNRGWPQVLEAMALMKHKDIKLKVIGRINDGTQTEFQKRVEKLGLKECVQVYDWMPFDEAFEHLQSAHVGIIAFQPGILNHVYAMPHKMFDYMAAGMAVVCPEFAVEVAPVVEETCCGLLINPASPEDIATKLDYLLSDRERLADMGHRGKYAVQKKYNWEAESKKLLKMYAEFEMHKITKNNS